MSTNRSRLKLFLLCTPCFVLYVILLTLYTSKTNLKYKAIDSKPDIELQYSNILDGCYHVYLDVGSNIGIQIRKLFEPSKYPEAKILPLFDMFFGDEDIRNRNININSGYVCAVGFEPNSNHATYLKQIESSYTKCGWRATFLTNTGVSDHFGSTKFYSDGQIEKNEWGGGILPPDVIKVAKGHFFNSTKSNYAVVNLVRLSDFLKLAVGKRKIPTDLSGSSELPPKVVIKIDIEGSEVDVIPDLLFSGGLEYVDALLVEWHAFLHLSPERKEAIATLETIINLMSNYSRVMKTKGGKYDFELFNIDDETFGKSKFELPIC